MSGKPNARRRNATIAMTQLPIEGRKGTAPPWPLDDTPKGYIKLWRELWAKPQAVAWERYGLERLVARYALILPLVEKAAASEPGRGWIGMMREIGSLEDQLGLNPQAMLKLRWEVAADEVAERRTSVPARQRMKAVAR